MVSGASSEPASGEQLLLGFRLDRELYAVELAAVREVLAAARILPVPDVAPYVSGVVNLRGSIVPIVDLRKKLERPPARASRRVVLVVAAGEERFGILIDEPPFIEKMSSVESSGAGRLARGTSGVAQILDLARLSRWE